VAIFALVLVGLVVAIGILKKTSRQGEGPEKDKEKDEITRLTQALAVAESARTEAELASRAKSEFLAILSHELRTPLNSILGFAAILENEMYGPLGSRRYVDYAHDIADSGDHLMEIVNDILDLSKVEAGKMIMEEAVLDVEEIIRGVLAMTKERAEERGITLKASLSRKLPRLLADGRLIKQMLLNLLSNAIDFTNPEGWVAVSAERHTGGGLTVAVSDTGAGMTAQELSRVMDPFYTNDGPFERPVRGTGLGLPLVKSMIELHGGEVSINSTQGVGTTVALLFPAARIIGEPQVLVGQGET